jgi:streptogramin lyase
MTRSTRNCTTRARRRSADWTRTRPRLEGLEDRCLLSITEFPVTTPTSGPWGIATGPDGNLWFAETNAGQIGMINSTTHAIAEFPIPTANSGPVGITAGPDGNLWFVELSPGAPVHKVGRIDPTTHGISEFTVANRATAITAGPDGNLWFTEYDVGQIGRIDPATHAVTELPIPYASSNPVGITAGADGNLWFTDGNGSVGVVALNPTSTTHLVIARQPPASLTADTPFGLAVQAVDSSGQLDSSFNGTVTVGLANNPSVATLGGTLTVTASGGVATFSDLTLTKAAVGYTFQLSSSGLGWAVNSAMTVTPATATQLAIT